MKKKIGIVIFVVLTILVIIFVKSTKAEQVEIYKVDKGLVENYIDEVGEFTAKDQYLINSKVTGTVKEIKKIEGDTVRVGDIILELDDSNLQLEISSLKTQIEGVYSEIANVSKKDSEEIFQVKNQIDIAQNDYYEKKDDYEKKLVLFEQGAISKVEMDTITRLYENSNSTLNIAKSNLSLQTKGISKELRAVYNSKIDSLGYNLKILENQADDFIIKAPLNGIITDRFVDNGGFVSPGTELIEISDQKEYVIKSDILVGDSVKIKEGSTVIIKDPETEIEYTGKISRIYPKAFKKISDLGIEQKRVKVEIISEDLEILKYGYEFDLKIIYEDVNDVIRIKDNAVFKISGENYVFLVDKNKLLLQNITIGLEGEDYIQVIEGLKENDLVVVAPGNNLVEGMKVSVE